MDATTLKAPTGTAAARRFTCQLEPRGRRRYVLRLSGALHAGWAGWLAAELAANRITIHRVRAQRAPTMLWEAEIEIESLPGGADPAALDLQAILAERRSAAIAAPPPALALARVRPEADAATVEIQAEDAVGFLERILGTFAFFSLFPCELQVETVGRRVVDVFRLQSPGGRAPSAAVLGKLEARLAELCAAPPAR